MQCLWSFLSRIFYIWYPIVNKPLQRVLYVCHEGKGPLNSWQLLMSCSIMYVSNFPEDGAPPVVLGDFSIHLNKPQATDFLALLGSFGLVWPYKRKPLQCKQPDLLLTCKYHWQSSCHIMSKFNCVCSSWSAESSCSVGVREMRDREERRWSEENEGQQGKGKEWGQREEMRGALLSLFHLISFHSVSFSSSFRHSVSNL